MNSTPAAFDLAHTYVKLDGDVRAQAVPVDPLFWQQIDSRPEFQHGRLVMVFNFTSDWPTWEIHPAGEEVVHVLAGAMEFTLHLPDGDLTQTLTPGATCLVPRNTWHTARVRDRCTALFITPCAGTRNAAHPEPASAVAAAPGATVA
jgi:mannose-6-phosphate isomerase-like protein (cupin superfamily)